MTDDSKEKSGILSLPDRAVLAIGNTAAWLVAVLIGIILVQVVLRYVFEQSYVVLEELQWHLYAVVFLLGLSYSYVKNAHVRLDVLHSKFSRPTKEKIEIIGIICFLWPMIYVFFMHSLPFVAESFRVGESSEAPLGLSYRWIIKSAIPIAFFLLFAVSASRLAQAVCYLKKRNASNGR
jgi:TRAP-type mannitol/chloroaromatic compound transport system permease small subunit